MKLPLAEEWFKLKGWKPHQFQKEAFYAVFTGMSGLLNAPTGSGKTYAMWFGMLEQIAEKQKRGLKVIWITPLRALAREIHTALQQTCTDLQLPLTIGIRTGDTAHKEKERQKRNMPDVLITTPESLHLMLAQKGYSKLLSGLQYFVADEWHELMGSKRGVQVELALSRLKTLNPDLSIWGISATIGNLEQAKEVLLGNHPPKNTTIRAEIEKAIEVNTLLPDEIEKYPWAGHLGIKLAHAVLPIINDSQSTLIFTNTRSQAEIWYQRLLDLEPALAGNIALHHGSINLELRNWVEDALHQGKLKAVIATSSLDLGVDFRPVDSVIQIGSAKGVARFIQRAGRSGHAPGQTSKIYFLPTHSLEIIEGAAFREAISRGFIESRTPYIRSFDVLAQYLATLAVSEGFRQEEVFRETLGTHCFDSVSEEEWNWLLSFITQGGEGLQGYEEFLKVIIENGVYKLTNRRQAMRHRLSVGTIVSNTLMQVKYMSGKNLGTIEESFISSLNPGDSFWFAGKNLELIQVRNFEAYVKKVQNKKGKVPGWQGGRMSLSSELSEMIRFKIQEYLNGSISDPEIQAIAPLLELQQKQSLLPQKNQFLIETLKSREGWHFFFFPFEGRLIHEGMAAVLAARMSVQKPASFSIAMNDYGFELLTDQQIEIEKFINEGIFSTDYLGSDALNCVNATEMAVRRFRDIASISGLVFQGYPGKMVKARHLQASSHLFFKVFQEYEPDNLLLRQAYDEVADFQLNLHGLHKTFEKINRQEIVIKNLDRPSPFSFPIIAERFREKYSNEDIETRIMKMKKQWKLE
ncbi:ligase-associated DNA damage response DEXH box helicase [Cytophagaceae bacterium ABcell3]|nr:ligase-associated DNA damage response DEXH box helicase [Cytophagaceae bacterium ABcell3]